ncbi:hypothetical protein FA13DRAFT_1819251 [Coprinellus micaceus]|uniref:DUF6533 domain-containing protein n=1 Tax=Coprinellus micaceus TaxID=71717 RepID=A0A4Y7SJI5_COPMI|nr:hypothetical protein FA13DRAFT_1819251 [Coprinellus micaceus]
MSSELNIRAIYISQTERYLTASALTFVLCDMVSTFEDEVRFVWRSKWTGPKGLYIASRYLGPIILLIMLQAGDPMDPTLEIGGFAALRLGMAYANVLSLIPARPSPSDTLFSFNTFTANYSGSITRYSHVSAMVMCTITSVIYLTLTLLKLKDSITDSEGRVRYEILKQVSYAKPLAAGVYQRWCVRLGTAY